MSNVVAVNVTKEEIAEMEKLCKSYSDAKRRVQLYDKYLAELHMFLGESAASRDAIIAKETAMRDARFELAMDIRFVDNAFSVMGERERMVLTQLYLDGGSWSNVKGEFGEKLSRSAISRARVEGLSQMAMIARVLRN